MDFFSDVGKYYGVDWVGMITTFGSLYYLGDKKWYGFGAGAVSALAWATFSFLAGSLPGFVANIVFFFLNLRGIYKWKNN